MPSGLLGEFLSTEMFGCFHCLDDMFYFTRKEIIAKLGFRVYTVTIFKDFVYETGGIIDGKWPSLVEHHG